MRRGRARSEPRFRSREWPRFLHAPDPRLLREFYVPALECAVRYDRCCAYFSSSVLAAAARGFGRLIERLEAMGEAAPRPALRLLVNEELQAEDVRALSERGDARPLEKVLGRRFRSACEALEKKRLQMLAWMVKRGFLEVRVGVMRAAGGILHAKFGVLTDALGDTLVFAGSGNESAQGLVSNYESLEVSTSWKDKDRTEHYRLQFEELWGDRHPDVLTVELPVAIREKLIRLAPKEAPTGEPVTEIERLRAAMVWRWLAESPYTEAGGEICDATAMVQMWPHQRYVVRETAEAWPEGRLLCDEVGMGKTLEAILVMRRLLAGRGVRRVLILVPASLTRQWQAELREKGGIIVPRLDGDTLVWPDGTEEKRVSFCKALERPLLLMSRETAKMQNRLEELLRAEPWDLVVLDEAHAARRREGGEENFNNGNLLLTMVRQLRHKGRARGFLFLSATPMQIHPWEPWDLLQPLGEGGPWMVDFQDVRRFYEGVRILEANGVVSEAQRDHIASLVFSDPHFPECDDMPRDKDSLKKDMVYGTAEMKAKIAGWLRSGSPLSRCLHRNTRNTLRKYYAKGLLDREPPRRKVRDVVWDFSDERERQVYQAASEYIERRFAEMKGEKVGKGFLLAIYRRRAASDLAALKQSLLRRQDLVERYLRSHAIYTELVEELPEGETWSELPEEKGDIRVSSQPTSASQARAEKQEIAALLQAIDSLTGVHSKVERLLEVLDEVTADGRACLVFTEYVDTMLHLREQLFAKYCTSRDIATYSGAGGSWWNGSEWQAVPRAEVARMLQDGKLRVVICTDAASEGLNLQAASALINYDLPYNPSKVEQRIGRIDRIGQQQPEVLVVNMLLKDSVDERVYTLLRKRCNMFEQFIGPMQPVLGQAERLLLGFESDFGELESRIDSVRADELANESYRERDAVDLPGQPQAIGSTDLREALEMLAKVPGYRVTFRSDGAVCVVRGPGLRKLSLGLCLAALERDQTLIPLNPSDPTIRRIADSLGKDLGETPLVVGSEERDGFRAATMLWVDQCGTFEVTSVEGLLKRVREWDGTPVSMEARREAMRCAKEASGERVTAMQRQAEQRLRDIWQRQTSAVQARLSLELCRTLGALTGKVSLGHIWDEMREEMKGQSRTADSLRRAYKKLKGYPKLMEHHEQSVKEYVGSVTQAEREAARTLVKIHAALDDPRWSVLDRDGVSS